MRTLFIRSCFVLLLTTSAPVLAQRTGLEDLVGARAGQAEGELQRRGYRNTGGEQGDDRSYTNWWNADRRQCVQIATMDGRYASITATPAPDCRQQADQRSPQRRPSWGSRTNPAGQVASGDLPGICKGQAAVAFDQRPSDVTTNQPIRSRNGATVSGWFDAGRRTTFFTCRFDEDDRFLSVR